MGRERSYCPWSGWSSMRERFGSGLLPILPDAGVNCPPASGNPQDRRGSLGEVSSVRYLVTVSCVGPDFLIRVPAFGLVRFVSDKKTIREEARRMIASCGAAAKTFDIDLELGRVVDRRGLWAIE
jgi:hypothetical protein